MTQGNETERESCFERERKARLWGSDWTRKTPSLPHNILKGVKGGREMGGQVGEDLICIDGVSAEAHSYLFKPASELGRQRRCEGKQEGEGHD